MSKVASDKIVPKLDNDNMNNYSIQPIETYYKNIKFRSKLEAKWARLFDILEIEYVYEPEGFKYQDFYYSPDFFIPAQFGGTFAEVKPTLDFNDNSWEKLEKFQLLSKKPILYFGATFKSIFVSYYKDNSDFIDTDYAVLSRCAKCHRFYFRPVSLGWQCNICNYYDGDQSFDLDIDFNDNELIIKRNYFNDDGYTVPHLKEQIRDITNYFRYDRK